MDDGQARPGFSRRCFSALSIMAGSAGPTVARAAGAAKGGASGKVAEAPVKTAESLPPAAPTVRRAYIDTSDGQVHYADEGSGPPLVMVHHTPRSLEYYAPLFPLMKHKFRLIAIDTPGFGGSDPASKPLTVPLIAERILEVADRLDLERFYLMGTHTGAAVAVALAGMAPDRVARLALMSTPLLSAEQRQRGLANLATGRPVSSDGSELQRYWRNYGMAWWRDEVARGHDIPIEVAQDFSGAYVRDILRAQSRWGEGQKAAFSYDTLGGLGKISAPTLVLALEGEGEPGGGLRPFLRTAATVKEHLANPIVDTIHATHGTFVTYWAANEVAASLTRFFEQGPL